MAEPTAFADAIVVAAGESRRMDGVDKLTAEVAGRPLLAWTLEAVALSPRIERIVVVAAVARVDAIRTAGWLPGKVVAVTAGGARRQESVAAGLAALDRLTRDEAGDDRVVLVHDGARPLASASLISAVADAAARHGAAIPILPVAETLKRVDDGMVVATVDRTGIVVTQTPQGVRRSLLHQAFAARPADGAETFTDEAALLEACRIPVHAIAGDPSNLKVTLPDDLRRVESALRGTAPRRVGLGSDHHPFGPGRPLAIGGIEIDRAPRLYGHSDGDVALHAVADALLGAAALGDLGRLFPADARTPRGIASADLLSEVVARVARAGFRPVSVDLVIVGARPRLADRLGDIAARVAGLLGLPAEAVNVKASTGNLEGMQGAGRGISAQAIALVEPIQ